MRLFDNSDENIKYNKEKKEWIFSYPKVQKDSVHKFIYDHKGLYIMADFTEQYLEYTSLKDEDMTDDTLNIKFTLVSWNPNSVTFKFTKAPNDPTEHVVKCTYTTKHKLNIKIPEPCNILEPYIGMELSRTKAIMFVFKAIQNCIKPLTIVRNFLNTCGAITGDFILVPTSAYGVRLFYRSMFVINIMFLGINLVMIEDGTLSIGSQSSRYTKIPDFDSFIQFTIKNISPERNSLPDPVKKDNPAYMIGLEDLEPFLQGYHNYVGSLSLFFFSKYYAQQEHTGRIHYDIPSLNIKFNAGQTQANFFMRNYILDVGLILDKGAPAVNDAETIYRRLSEYFRRILGRSPFRVDNFMSFLKLIQLPIGQLRDISAILAKEPEHHIVYVVKLSHLPHAVHIPTRENTNTSQNRRPKGYKPAVRHDTVTKLIRFTVDYHLRATNELLISLPLQWTYTTNNLKVDSLLDVRDPRQLLLTRIPTELQAAGLQNTLLNIFDAVCSRSIEELRSIAENANRSLTNAAQAKNHQ
mmetsp:Transcript_19243/g.21422  ORF Transcript_19243/g.21422 Transcript_19243/m.21422 type:complete len:524 (+) Transcript_19243:1-1572(+)